MSSRRLDLAGVGPDEEQAKLDPAALEMQLRCEQMRRTCRSGDRLPPRPATGRTPSRVEGCADFWLGDDLQSRRGEKVM
jgi:hypothetical protein